MYRNIIAILFVMLALLTPLRSTACGEIIPPQEVVEIVKPHVSESFPTMADVLAIIKIESSFRQSAVNPNLSGSGTSNGIMQVNGGSFEIHANVAAGVKILKDYHRMTKSRVGAVKAYNIGIGNYLRGKQLKSAEAYYQRFKIAREMYEKYPTEVRYLGDVVGCSILDVKRNPYHGRPPGSNLLLPYKGAGRNHNQGRETKGNFY